MEEFFATLLRGVTLFQAEIAQLSPAVLAWMWAMRIAFGASIVFLPRAGAVATLGTMIATAVLRFYVKGSYPDMLAPQIGALTHVVLWIPLIVFLLYSIRYQPATAGSRLDRAYTIWRVVAVGMLAVSLVFDIREAVTAL